MSRGLEDGRYTRIGGQLEPVDPGELLPGSCATDAVLPPVAEDLRSLRIQSLAGRGLIDPKALRLREIQELSASILAYIRQQHTP